MTLRPRIARLPLAVVATAVLVAPTAVMAANPIEDELPAASIHLVKKLRAQHVKTIGVLKFRVQKGNDAASFRVGPMNAVVTTAVENILILRNTGDPPPFQVLKSPSQVLARNKLSYLEAKDRDKLFGLKYPLAWGDALAEPDAFLTGVVQVDPDRESTTVVFELLDRETRQLREIYRFKVRTTRSILNDVCDNFLITRGTVEKAGPGVDRKALESARSRNAGGGAKTSRPVAADGADEAPVVMDVLYNGQLQQVSVDPTGRGEGQFKLAEPEEGVKVVFKLTNRTEKPVAVVLVVNGQNSLNYPAEDLNQLEPLRMTKWFIPPKGEVEVVGYFRPEGKSAIPFRILSTEESTRQELDLNPHLGAIHLFTFTQGVEADVPKPGLRIVAPAGASTPKEAADRVRERLGKPAPAGLIAPGGEEIPADLKAEKFDKPVQVSSQTIWYYSRKNRENPPSP